jgi:serine protease AprX
MRCIRPLLTPLVSGLSIAAGLASTVLASQPAASDTWARVELDRQALTAWLGPVESLDYGSFQWIPAHLLETSRRSAPAVVTLVDSPFRITLGGQTFDPRDRPLYTTHNASTLATTGATWWLVQFAGPTKRDWLHDLSSRSLQPVQYIHPFTYVVWGDAHAIAGLNNAALAHVRAVSEFRPDYKFSPLTHDEDTAQRRELMALVANEHVPALQGRMGAVGAAIRAITAVNSLLSVIYLSATGIRGAELAEFPEVYALQDIPRDSGLRGEAQNQLVAGQLNEGGQARTGYLRWLDGTGYDGSGVIVSVVDDTGFRRSHFDLVDQPSPCVALPGPLTSCTTSGSSDHATHVAGAIAGTGASGIVDAQGFLRGLGVAPGASLVSQDFRPLLQSGNGGMVPDGMRVIFTEAARSGAVISNHSWGPASTPRGYDIPTLQVDVATRDADPETSKPDPMLAVWAIMNGYGDRGTGPCAPSSLGSPDEAKNILAVGATYLLDGAGRQQASRFGDLAYVSGHGNACDGRRVPHLVAPGCSTDNPTARSDNAHDGSAVFCGTSMAAPNVAGAAAVFVEKYRATYGATPSPALIKAALTAVARNLAGHHNANPGGNSFMGHRPDRFQGYGRLDLDAAVNPRTRVIHVDQTHVFDETGEAWTLQIEADDPTQPIQLMLAWSDAPGHGLGGSTAAWVNDLDLRAHVNGETYLGNAVGDDGWSLANGSADGANNLEGIFLSPAQHNGSMLDVSVLATNIAADALSPRNPSITRPQQDFALVCVNCSDRINTAQTNVDLAMVSVTSTTTSSAGTDVTLSFAVQQPGPATTQPLRVTVELPEGAWHLQRRTSDGWQCTGAGRSVQCQADVDAQPGMLAKGHLRLRTDPSLPTGTVLNGKLTVAARGNTDPNAGNNTLPYTLRIGERDNMLFVDGFESALLLP